MLKASKPFVMFIAIGFAMLVPTVVFSDSSTTSTTAEEKEEFVNRKFFPALNGVPGKYTVMLYRSPDASASPEILVNEVGGRLGYIYKQVFSGFEADLTDDQAEALSRNPQVQLVEQDSYAEEEVSSVLPYCYSGFATNSRLPLEPLPRPAYRCKFKP